MVIETFNLTKQYGGQGGCQDICLAVDEGQIFGFLGPNGAGKSTLVKTLMGLLLPTSGKAMILGKPLGDREARRRVGYLPENFSYHPWLTARELLQFHGGLYELEQTRLAKRIPEVLAMVGLQGAENKRVGAFSKGMQQRIGLAVALLPEPALLVLDEPTSALDPLGRRDVRSILLQERTRGTTVLLNSHLLSEVELICDHVAIINKGRIVAAGERESLLHGGIEVELLVRQTDEPLRELLLRQGQIVLWDRDKAVIALRERDDIPRLAQALHAAGVALYGLIPRQQSLEDLFVRVVEEGKVT